MYFVIDTHQQSHQAVSPFLRTQRHSITALIPWPGLQLAILRKDARLTRSGREMCLLRLNSAPVPNRGYSIHAIPLGSRPTSCVDVAAIGSGPLAKHSETPQDTLHRALEGRHTHGNDSNLRLDNRPGRQSNNIPQRIRGIPKIANNRHLDNHRRRRKHTKTHKEPQHKLFPHRTLKFFQKANRDKGQNDIAKNRQRSLDINALLRKLRIPTLGTGDGRVPVCCNGLALRQLDDIGDDGEDDLEGNHEVQEDTPAGAFLEAEEQEGDADLGARHGPAPWELADEDELGGHEPVGWGDVEHVAAEAVGYGREEEGYLQD